MKIVAIIPARYDSTRLTGKLIHPEAKRITGKYIIEHVYERVKESVLGGLIEDVIVATDDKRIFDVVKGFGGNAEMTSCAHKSGTDRIAEVAVRLDADIVVNVQGDEPEIRSEMIEALIKEFQGSEFRVRSSETRNSQLATRNSQLVMATLANEIKTVEELLDPNVVKVVLDNYGYALYFSRAPIPYVQIPFNPPFPPHPTPLPQGERIKVRGDFLKHIGIYAYRRDFLLKYTRLPSSRLEEAEKLEQLRALSNGYKIKVSITPFECEGIDTEEDLKRFIDKFRVKS